MKEDGQQTRSEEKSCRSVVQLFCVVRITKVVNLQWSRDIALCCGVGITMFSVLEDMLLMSFYPGVLLSNRRQ